MKNKFTVLNKDKNEVLHSIVAKLLWITKIARPDLETTIGFLYTRVSKSDENDGRKLRRTVAFVRCTIENYRIIGSDDLKNVVTWTDTEYEVKYDAVDFLVRTRIRDQRCHTMSRQ